MIRVLLLIPTLDQSGAEKQLTLLACGLPRDEFHVEVVALTRGGPYERTLQEHGIPVTIVGKRWKFDPTAYRRLKRLLAERRPEILHTWMFAANAYGRLAAGDLKRRATYHAKVVVSERCVDTWKRGWQLWLDRKLVARTARMIANSPAVSDFYRQIGFPADRLVVIRNGIESPQPVARSRADVLQDFQIPLTARVIVFVGRLATQKRVDDLLWAFALLRNVSDEDVRFLVVGDGPERPALERFAQRIGCGDWIRFTGHRSEVGELLSSCDLFWLASAFEGQSNSLMEAMSYGLPVIASDIAANQDLVRHEQTGLLVPVGDRPAFTQAAHRLLSDTEFARRLGQTAAERMQMEFSVQRMVSEHARLYREIAGG